MSDQVPVRDRHARAPLLDRLIARDPGSARDPVPHRSLSRGEVLASVERELSWVLNTRCPLAASELVADRRSTVDYGLPDLAPYATSDSEDHLRVAELVRSTVAAFEPRLTDVRVTVEPLDEAAVERLREKASREGTPPPHPGRMLAVTIAGRLRVGSIVEPVIFPTVLGRRRGEFIVESAS